MHKTVRLIGIQGEQLGIMQAKQAFTKAQEQSVDLVEVSPNTNPPVCKLMDYGKHLYKLQKNTKKSKSPIQKELRLKPRIGEHDLGTKIRTAKKFIEDGIKVQWTMMFKGREIVHRDLGQQVLDKIVAELQEISIIEKPFMDGRSVKLTVSPKK